MDNYQIEIKLNQQNFENNVHHYELMFARFQKFFLELNQKKEDFLDFFSIVLMNSPLLIANK